MTLDRLFLALHVLGAFMWIGALFALLAFLDAYAEEPDAAAKGRLLKHVRRAAIVPDVGATIAILFGAHWLFKLKLYQMPYMHAKLTVVVLVIALHGYLKRKVKQAKRGEALAAPPVFVKPMLTLMVFGILFFVLQKWPH